MLPIRISQPEEMSKLSLSASDAGFANFIDILFLKKKKLTERFSRTSSTVMTLIISRTCYFQCQ